MALKNINTNSSATASTNDAGVYVFRALTPGTYSLEAEKPGFKKLVQDDISILTATTSQLDLALTLGHVQRVGHSPSYGNPHVRFRGYRSAESRRRHAYYLKAMAAHCQPLAKDARVATPGWIDRIEPLESYWGKTARTLGEMPRQRSCGYYGQANMIRGFHEFAACRPGRFLQYGAPSALVSSQEHEQD